MISPINSPTGPKTIVHAVEIDELAPRRAYLARGPNLGSAVLERGSVLLR
jgi:hypothetical protein